MEEMDIATVKAKAILGVKALTSRAFIQQIISALGIFLLSIFLKPDVFGIFYVVSAIINFLTYFSDIGLAAALIQKKESLTDDDLRTTFTIQQILVGSAMVVTLVFSQTIADFYALHTDGLWLLRALIVSFFLSSLKTIPSILLERKLDFHILIIPQIAEQFVYYLVAIFLAWRGYGVTSFTYAVVLRSLVGLVVIYALRPWMPIFGIRVPIAKRLLRYGIPIQINSFLALLKDDLLTIFLGKILPFTYIGYIGWAKRYAELPLRLILDSVVRVTFPAFSRLQHSKEALVQATEKTLFGISLCVLPIYILMSFAIQPFIYFIPKYTKWEPAVIAFFLFCAQSVLASLSTPLTNVLNAIGRIKITLYLMIMWIILTWIFTLVGIHYFSYVGVALAALIVSTSIIVVIKLVQREFQFSFVQSVKNPTIAAIIMTVWVWMFQLHKPYNIFEVGLIALTGLMLYCVVLLKLEPVRVKNLFHNFIH